MSEAVFVFFSRAYQIPKRRKQMSEPHEFDVAISFAGTERTYAQALRSILQANGLKIFLDEDFQAEIWGTNLIEYLNKLYRERAAYCLMLISEEYKSRAYTRVERRAALDRLIRESSEYILPVKIDDSWIEGLPEATGYQDLRVKGVVAIAELVIHKIRGAAAPRKLVIPAETHIPRVPLGTIPSRILRDYLLEHCKRERVAVFGALIYDEGSAELRKLLRDPDYWDALDHTSGPHLEVFALRDSVDERVEVDMNWKLMTAASFDQTESKRYRYSRLLNEYFGVKDTRIPYPTILLFLVEAGKVTHFRNVPLEAGNLHETFSSLQAMFSCIANTLECWLKGGGTGADSLWETLKDALLRDGYTIYKKWRTDSSAEKSIFGLTKFVEEPSPDTQPTS
jgi:hypothetical protein